MAKLIWVSKDGNRYLEDEHFVRFLADEATSEPATFENVTIEALAQYCDNQAEADNYHMFANCHLALAKMIEKHSSSEIAKSVLFEVAQYGGLPNWAEGVS